MSTHAILSRRLARSAGQATLCTLAVEPAGHPYGSLVTFAVDAQGRPLLLLSDLAEHTRNLRHDSRASLVIGDDTAEDPLTAGRVTLLGRAQEVDPAVARETFLSRHPQASQYADFKDFHWFRLDVESVRYIGGFGRMSWVDSRQYLTCGEPDEDHQDPEKSTVDSR